MTNERSAAAAFLICEQLVQAAEKKLKNLVDRFSLPVYTKNAGLRVRNRIKARIYGI